MDVHSTEKITILVIDDTPKKPNIDQQPAQGLIEI